MSLIRQFANSAFRWKQGRQNSGYEKMLLLHALFPLPFDVYLLRFREGSEIKPHVDPVAGGRHYRLNIVIKQAGTGGRFACECPIYETARIKFFRPDVSEHSVSRVEQGTRYVFSVGWVRRRGCREAEQR